MVKVFVVILNWNRPDDTVECLESINRLSVVGYQLSVVVVDNASSDDSIEKIQNDKLKFKIIENKENLGFAGGNNVGIKYAIKNGADYVMVLNNDTIVHPDLVLRIIEATKKHSNFGVASPKIYFEREFEFHKERYKKDDLGKVIWYAGGQIDWDNVYGKTRGVDEVDKGRYDEVEETDFATGTCMFLSRKALEKVGLFDEKYFMYYEDTDLSLRIKKAGFKVLYIPKAVVWHKVAQSSGIGSKLNDYFTTRNRLLFGMRYARLRTRFALYKESLRLLVTAREWQKRGILDFYFGRFGKGSWE
ncbi:hypothetical protein A2715_04690 [Candidatus Woesebacteria bacterium RIFCSPHIGHO2_01_FULL_39_32]|uniref:Glycosyltransferase 2-like domain-containing protein n=1 Tax=Candidatus Woesebacteria bacterium RIFCSPLOWO2_01_FULL_39_25 TaxID=1802521 RepID=A0A1F8BLA5_9BACT|nr:MAG: hypothetical protein A2124_03225 [Candidatus Woesebacteria bacterium GWB1_37_5]OGM25315.1 MAG: hypothetical protein A2715_04690 [Candidatus Woesebacteria bacterium RIFCSPHIGHO2_01_FULL_39_32]OGM37814.1 MAG: hypothetical protein A3F01_01900 [Candidatus Woesebacteria bacterium RIFCSPHIGHO2_12_FULL_38_11]OGM64846.1 MAG: hypothetical protein A2893_04300 [Candidatus Woesebacteria bacterium RIFCSPLOWO2_01_FULL_39_25]